MVRYVKEHWITLFFGTILGTVGVLSTPALLDLGADGYDALRPVVSEWKVTKAETEGNDLILEGTLIKNRDCTYLPSVMGRDAEGEGYTVVLTNPERVMDAVELPQKWGPWRVLGGAGKRLTYTIVYICGLGARPIVFEFGTYPP